MSADNNPPTTPASSRFASRYGKQAQTPSAPAVAPITSSAASARPGPAEQSPREAAAPVQYSGQREPAQAAARGPPAAARYEDVDLERSPAYSASPKPYVRPTAAVQVAGRKPYVAPPPPSPSNSSTDGGRRSPPLPNEPEEEPEEDDDDDDTDDITNEERSSLKRMPTFKGMLFDMLLALFMLGPACILMAFKDFPWYNLIEVKGPEDALNPFMEFWRWSVFFSIAYVAYSVLDFALGTMPTLVLAVLNKIGLFRSKRLKRTIGYLRNIHPYLTGCAFFLALLWLGGILLYTSAQSLANIKLGALSAAATPAAAAAIAAAAEPIKDARYYVERMLIFSAIIAFVLSVEKYLLEAIKAKFHRMGLAFRIKDINSRQWVLQDLYDGAMRGEPRIVAARRVNDGDTFLEIDEGLNLRDRKRAHSIADKIFRALCPAGRNYLIKEDLGKFVSGDLADAFAVIDTNGNEQVDEQEMRQVVEELQEEIIHVKESRTGNARIIGKLDRLMMVIAVILGLALAVPFFDVGIGQAWATFGVISTALGFIFQNAGRVVFEALIFVFAEHAFDVGDRVIVDGENLVVQNIEIFTTRFVKWDGVIVYVPNSVLSGKNIYNVRRSGLQSEEVVAKVSAETTTEDLRAMLELLTEKTRKEAKDFSGYVDLVEFNVLDEQKMEVKLAVQYKSNFQNQAMRNSRRSKFDGLLKDTLAELDIEYFPV